MNLFILVYLLSIIIFGFLSTIIWRGNLVLIILLPASEFLGFVDPMKIAVKGSFDIHALIVLIIFFAITISIYKIKILVYSPFFIPISIFFLLWSYGIIYPWISGNSSLFYSIKASKEFLTFFVFIAVLLFINTKKDIELGWNYIFGLGIYYSALEILGQAVGPILKGNMSYQMRSEDLFFWKIYLPFWPVILISFYNFYYKYIQTNSKYLVHLIISAAGLLLTFFRSYILAAFIALPTILLLCKGISKYFIRTILFITGICFCLYFISFTSIIFGNESSHINKISHKFVLSAIEEITTHTGGSLIGRDRVSESRKIILEKQPYLGYGFIDKDSEFGKTSKRVIIGDNLGFIDKGTLDIPIKFGRIGFIIIILNMLFIIFILARISKRHKNESFKIRCMTVAAATMTYILVLPVHAPLTYSFGLLPLGISLGLIEKERILLDEEMK